MRKRKQDPSAGPGGGERSEPEPGPADGSRRSLGHGAGHMKRYTPEERRWALEAWAKSGLSAQVFSRQWGVSTPTLHEWKRAVARGGPKALEHPGAKTTGRRPGAMQLAPAVAVEIVATKRTFPDFGLRKVRDYLARFVGLRVSAGGVRAVLARAGVPPTVPPGRRGRVREAPHRFERSRPGELWQTDITTYRLARQGRSVQLIAYLDDYSRYVVSWSLHTTISAAIAKETLLEGVVRFGKPKEVLTDQGPQYHAWRGKSAFRRLLEREGIQQVVARSHHPQTLGKAERLWETIGQYFWDRVHPEDLVDARERLGHFIAHYNHFRPHQGIGGMVPADRFFGAESEVRKAIEAAISKNELRLALGERPRRSVYLVGQVGDEVVSLHGERGRLVVATQDGVVKDVDLNELGMKQEVRHGADNHSGSGESGGSAGGRDQATQAADAGGRPAGGVPGERDPRGGDGGGAQGGAGARERAPGVLARAREQGGALASPGDPADTGVADVAACDGRDGGRALAAADGETRSDAATRSGGEDAAQAGPGTPGGDGPAEAADRTPADDAAELTPRAPEGAAGCSEARPTPVQGVPGEVARPICGPGSGSASGAPSGDAVTSADSRGPTA